jgi:hypothetical protein
MKRSGQALSAVESAILQAVAYADVFDYPLTAQEVHRYLAGVPATSAMLHSLLGNGRLVPRRLASCGGYFTLPGRETIVKTRRRRAEVAARMWPRALRYARIIAGLPFVRMVAVTGALAMDNVDSRADIDYFIVTEPGRLWLCRALVIALVRLAARYGDVVCPNYFLSADALILHERDPFTAHELVQMVPIAGMATYWRLRQLNAWTRHFLPNADGPPQPAGVTPLFPAHPPGSHTMSAPFQDSEAGSLLWRLARGVAESALKTPPGARLEGWEMARKVRKFNRQRDGQPGPSLPTEAAFCADWCKGHFDNHGQRTLAAFADRLRALEELERKR